MAAMSAKSPESDSLWTRLSRAHAVVPLVLACIFAVVTVAAWRRFAATDSLACPTTLVPDKLWPTAAFSAIVLAFLLGGLLGRLPHRPGQAGAVTLFAAQVGLTSLILAITAAWWYETRALANPDTLRPITYYIMCIKSVQNDWTLVVFMLGALIAGRWLWHRPGAYF